MVNIKKQQNRIIKNAIIQKKVQKNIRKEEYIGQRGRYQYHSDLNLTISIITLNVHDINTPTKRQILSQQIKNARSIYTMRIRNALSM